MNRPFEVGDLVVSKTYGVGVILYIDERCPSVFFSEIEKKVTFWENGSLSIHEVKPDIRCIRKPRPENPESRAIVAMLKNNVRTIKKTCNRFRPVENKHQDKIEKLIYFCATQEIALARRLADDAKSMLR